MEQNSLENHKEIWTLDPYKTTNLPHKNCNWVVHNVLVGSAPRTETIQSLLRIGCQMFINLCDDQAYKIFLPSTIEYVNLNMPVGSCPSLEAGNALIGKILEARKTKIVYIHCYGGNGRTGMLAACIYGRVCGVQACEAIKAVTRSRNESRISKEHSHVPVPESNKQVWFVGRVLGIESDQTLPDRSDKNWRYK